MNKNGKTNGEIHLFQRVPLHFFIALLLVGFPTWDVELHNGGQLHGSEMDFVDIGLYEKFGTNSKNRRYLVYHDT